MATILAQQSRPSGVVSSPQATVPSNISFALFTGLMDQATAGDASNTMRCQIERFNNTTQLWEQILDSHWVGGVSKLGVFRVPLFGIDVVAYRGQSVRGTLTTNQTFTWGMDLTTS